MLLPSVQKHGLKYNGFILKKIFFVPRTFLQKVKNIIKKKIQAQLYIQESDRVTRFKLPSRVKRKTQTNIVLE